MLVVFWGISDNCLEIFVTYLFTTALVVSQSMNTLGLICIFCLIGVRYKSYGIAGTSPSAILKRNASLIMSFLLCWRVGRFNSFSILVMFPGVIVIIISCYAVRVSGNQCFSSCFIIHTFNDLNICHRMSTCPPLILHQAVFFF